MSPLCLQDAQPHSGLLQASLITLYTIFITWSALANVPSKHSTSSGSLPAARGGGCEAGDRC